MVRNLLTGLVLCGLLAGCSTAARVRRSLAPAYKPANVFVRQPKLPASIRRIAVLPLPRTGTDASLNSGVELLTPVLFEELAKQHLADLIAVSPEELRALTGTSSWTAEAQLPLDFFRRLSQATGCDAVMFSHLTAYRAFPPLRVGWKVRLVDCSEMQTWWAVDDVFDAGADGVISGAESYARSQVNLPNPMLEDTGILQSPRRFGQYTAHAIALTIPHH